MNFKASSLDFDAYRSRVENKVDTIKAILARADVGYLLIFLSIFLGIWIRLKGLGKWPFDFDEFYIAESVKNILKYGVPKFDLGGYYVRGILIQYLSTALVLSGLKPEFALRLIPVIFNLLTIPPLYILAKRISGKNLAAAIVVVFSLSLWEIEFSRYARMYAPFQTIFLWYLVFLYLVIIERKRKFHKWLYVISFSSIFVYEGSIFIILLNFLPLIINKDKIKVTDILFSTFILVFAIIYLSIDFVHLGTTNVKPVESIENRSQVDMPPAIFISTLSSIWSYMFILWLLGFSIFASVKIANAREFDFLTKLVLIFVLIFSIMNLIALAIYVLFVLFLFNWISIRDFRNSNLRWCLLALVISSAYWIVYGLSTDVWLNGFQVLNISLLFKLKEIIVALLKYPNIYNEIIELYFGVAPVFSIMTMLFIGIGILRVFAKPYDELRGFRVLLAILVILGNAVVLLNIPWKTTRYSFFLYPVLLLLVLSSMEMVIRTIAKNKGWTAGLLFISISLFWFASEDFNIHHFTNIDSKEVNFRKIYGINSPMANHIIKRRDVRGVADFIKGNMGKKDKILTTFYQVGYYFGSHIDYFCQGLDGAEAREYAALGGTKEKWMNADLIHDKEKLFQMLKNPDDNLWVIINSQRYRKNGLEKEIAKNLEDSLVFQSYEGGINVYRIPKQKAGRNSS